MNNSELFTKAHKLAKATIKAGDNYQATFALCLAQIRKEENNKVKAKASKVRAILWTIPEALAQAMFFIFVLIIGGAIVALCGYLALESQVWWLSIMGGFCAASLVVLLGFIGLECWDNVTSEYRKNFF